LWYYAAALARWITLTPEHHRLADALASAEAVVADSKGGFDKHFLRAPTP
jgi:hypothetical protein